MKNIWLLYYEKYVDKNRLFIEKIINTGRKYGLDIMLVTVEMLQNILKETVLNESILKESVYNGVIKPDAVISRVINPYITDRFESMGIRTYNSASVSRLCNNKAETIRFANSLNIAHIPSIAISLDKTGKYIYEKIECAKLQEYNGKLSYISDTILDDIFYGNRANHHNISDVNLSEYVIKSVTGHGGREVMLLSEYCKNHAELGIQEKDAQEYYADKYIIQPLMSDYISDVRIYIVGNELIGAVKRTASGGFKANYSLGADIGIYNPDYYTMNIVNKILSAKEFSYIGIDFLLAGDKIPIFNEIEDVVGARMLSACGIDGYVEKYIEYISHDMISC